MNVLELMRTFTEAPGPSGRETTISDVLLHHWRDLADDVQADPLGSLIAVKHGQGSAPRPALMVAAHMDEIGLIVIGVEREFIRVHALGGTDPRILLGQEVVVHGKHDLPGVVGSRPPHVLPSKDRKKVPEWEEIFVDVGLRAEDVADLVQVGDHITFRQSLVELQGDLVAGKSLDNRASLVALTLALDALQRVEHAWDFYAVATIQEELGVKGAITSAYGVAPQIAVALDVTFAKQHDDSDQGVFELGKGPTICIGPNFHPQVVSRLRDAASDAEIPYQLEPVPGSSGTDAWAIQVVREGIPSGLISVPIRYMHQPVETASLQDVRRAARILARFAAGLDADFRPRWEDEV